MRKSKLIELKKQNTEWMRDVNHEAKLPYCVLCRKEVSSFCNSHSIPQFILKNIAVDGKVCPFHYIDEPQFFDKEIGVKSALTFFNICRDCDSKYFQEYESETALSEIPNNQVLAEIALKNHLLMFYKWRLIAKRNKKMSAEYDFLDMNNSIRADRSNERFSKRAIQRTLAVLKNHTQDDYILAYYRMLDWKVPVCIQTVMTMKYNIDGTILNNLHDYSPNAPIHDLHLCVFPLKEKTAVFAFFHKDETNNWSWKKQFDELSEEDKLIYINYLVFCYTENGFLSLTIPERILRRRKLVDLCRENRDIDFVKPFFPPKPVKPKDIPNFLSEDFSKRLGEKRK